MPLTERQALALIRSGTSVTELVRQHGHDLEVHMDFGRGVIAAARLDLVDDSETGEAKIRATADVVDAKGRKATATLTSSIEHTEDFLQEAIDNNYGKLALAAAADFITARGGSRKMLFARRFGGPASAGVGSAKALAAHPRGSNEVVMSEESTPEASEPAKPSEDEFVNEFKHDPRPDDEPVHARKWR